MAVTDLKALLYWPFVVVLSIEQRISLLRYFGSGKIHQHQQLQADICQALPKLYQAEEDPRGDRKVDAHASLFVEIFPNRSGAVMGHR